MNGTVKYIDLYFTLTNTATAQAGPDKNLNYWQTELESLSFGELWLWNNYFGWCAIILQICILWAQMLLLRLPMLTVGRA